MSETKKRERLIDYALTFLHFLYFWGGDDPGLGWDCSGFVIEVLKSIGLLPHDYDNTANGLWERFRHGERNLSEDAKSGDLVFWFKDDWAYHIALAINEVQVIGASGGGRPEFDLYYEVKKDPLLKLHYENYSREEFYAECLNDYSIKQLKQFLIRDEAIRRNAFIKIRPIIYRGLKFKIVNPFHPGEPS